MKCSSARVLFAILAISSPLYRVTAQSAAGKTEPPKAESVKIWTAEELAVLGPEELEAIYRKGGLPVKLSVLDGDPVLINICMNLPKDSPKDKEIRAMSARGEFPWQGKSFRVNDTGKAEGFNRMFFDKELLVAAPFKLAIMPSSVDGKDCVGIDYKVKGSAGIQTWVIDEMREVSPGLFLCNLTLNKKVLGWFAVDTSRSATEKRLPDYEAPESKRATPQQVAELQKRIMKLLGGSSGVLEVQGVNVTKTLEEGQALRD